MRGASMVLDTDALAETSLDELSAAKRAVDAELTRRMESIREVLGIKHRGRRSGHIVDTAKTRNR